MKTNISRSDEIWKNFKYKGLNAAQLFKRYRKIIVGTKIHKNINSIKKLGNLKEIADMRALKKLMNIQKDEDFHVKEKVYETRKLIKPPPQMLSKTKTQTTFLKKSDYSSTITKEPEVIEIIEQDFKLYCICKRRYEDGEKMIECDRCQDWLHFECVGYVGELDSKETLDLKFVCPKCDENDEEESRRLRKLEYEPIFKKYYQKKVEQQNEEVILEDNNEEKPENLEIIVNSEKLVPNEEQIDKVKEINHIEEKQKNFNSDEENLEDTLENLDEHHLQYEKKDEIIEKELFVRIENNDDKMEEENENISTSNQNSNPLKESEEKRKNKKENPIEFNCITKDYLQNDPNNSFNNKKITDYFVPISKSKQKSFKKPLFYLIL